MQKVGIFGSTGSVGRQALDVVAAHPQHLRVSVLAAGSRFEELAAQARRFQAPAVAIADPDQELPLRRALGPGYPGQVLAGPRGLEEAASLPDMDCVLAAVTGIRGLPVTLAAVRAGKRLALANKESLVAAGPLVLRMAAASGAELIPVDSEHSALFQALQAGKREEVHKLVLTGSGGPFRERPRETWSSVTIEEALRHPNWDMGPKITVDSATMMNKALEIVEARFLFDIPADAIQVVIHPQSIVHSMVLFRDGSVIAQMGLPDMRHPIQYALTYPERLPVEQPVFEPAAFDGLHFERPDLESFPSIRLGFEAARRGGTAGAVLNAANESAVALFLDGSIPFPTIFELVEDVVRRSPGGEATGLQAVMEADRWAREEVMQCF